jgi:hypothetical protein
MLKGGVLWSLQYSMEMMKYKTKIMVANKFNPYFRPFKF